jgi:hypothetical protein
MTEAVNDISASMTVAINLVEKIAQKTTSFEEETIAKRM